MSLSGDRLARAEARSDLARARLKATAARLRARLAPRELLSDALVEVRQVGETGAQSAKHHPFAIASVVAILSTLLVRHRRKETAARSRSLPTERPESRRARRSK